MINAQKFQTILNKLLPETQGLVAVAVSGGPDSMALLKLLSEAGFACHALIVDHGLRDGSADEAAAVAAQIDGWGGVAPHILTWEEAADSRIQEEARNARYALMAEHCANHDIQYLFLGHHMDDQAETFLFRLAKGSGLDGLAAMQPVQVYSEALNLVRPLLEVPKAQLVEFCQAQSVGFIEDPSNTSGNFARVRLRKSAEILAEEGLTPKRLSVTARRISRARRSLEILAEQAFDNISLADDADRIVLNLADFLECVDEVGFRVILQVIKTLSPGENYLPRMEKIEDLFEGLRADEAFRKRTLGGLIFERKDKDDQIIVFRENV